MLHNKTMTQKTVSKQYEIDDDSSHLQNQPYLELNRSGSLTKLQDDFQPSATQQQTAPLSPLSPPLSPTIQYSQSSPKVLSKLTDKQQAKKIARERSANLNSSSLSNQSNSPQKVSLKKQNSNSSSGSNQSNKRRSSWRNLLTPSYKSRSDEFHKLFCDKIPTTERLIADYACALHREILIQGRIYISVNYIAFYSNLFSWITKLVVRLRDIHEIYKANTARIIPNAIQIILTNGDKHVFASFVARDKSYVMLLRIWQNNLMNERMTDQEIRNLVYFSYGKDLGMSDNEELKINSPDPVTPANIPDQAKLQELDDPQLLQKEVDQLNNGENQMKIDTNNNHSGGQASQLNDECSIDNQDNEDLRKSKTISDLSSNSKHTSCPTVLGETCHKRYSSFDLNHRAQRVDQNDVIREVVGKLKELSCSYERHVHENLKEDSHGDSLTYSPAASSAVVVDTPTILDKEFENNHAGTIRQTEIDYLNLSCQPETNQQLLEEDLRTADKDSPNLIGEANHEDEDEATTRRVDGEDFIELTTHCECGEHKGELIADQEFDINIDTLFTLIFTNSKFMRTYMIRRGMTDTIISGWKRSNNNNNGDMSNSSTLSGEGRLGMSEGDIAKRIRIKQVRQLNYSMNLGHMWAKQVQVEEKQNICQVKPGVYVLKSQTINSGIPYGETFTVDISYCLTRNGDINKSRMLIHSFVNFNKEKQNWKLSMIKSTIEKQSIQGVRDFINDLTSCIKEYISRTLERSSLDKKKNIEHNSESDEKINLANNRSYTNLHQQSSRKNSSSQLSANQNRHFYRNGSLVRAKSKLKEEKLRNMYRYYIHDDEDIEEGVGGHEKFSDNADHLEELPDSESSLFSFNDIDDNGSMMMMVHATDDQFSDGNNSCDDRNPTKGSNGMGSLDRSFSDVDTCMKQNGRIKTWKSSTSQLKGSKKRLNSNHDQMQGVNSGFSKDRGINLLATAAAGTTSNQFRARDYNMAIGGLSLGTISARGMASFVIVMLLIILLVMIVTHIMLLRRLDSLEHRLQMQCCQYMLTSTDNESGIKINYKQDS